MLFLLHSSVAAQTYLFSVELPDTLIALVAASTEVVIVSSAKKGALAPPPVCMLVRARIRIV